MGVTNKIILGSQPNVTVKSLCHLEQFYSQQNPSVSQRQNKMPMELLNYWMENSTEGKTTKHLFIDEAPVETDSQSKVDVIATCKVVRDLGSLLPSSGHLWISYHSKVLRDQVEGSGLEPSDLTKFKQEMEKINMLCPPLRHNMRNSHQVAKAGEEVKNSFDVPTTALDAALPPKYVSLDPAPLPLLIPCDNSNFKAAIVKAYRDGLGVERGKEAQMCVVILCYEKYSSDVVQVLTGEGARVVTYYKDSHRQQLVSFLTKPGCTLHYAANFLRNGSKQGHLGLQRWVCY